jgi:CRISPR system Cascade subunit CasE
MYLSRVMLNPQRRATRAWISSPQRIHAAVLGGFPGAHITDAGRVLWRLDQSNHRNVLYVVSPMRPDFSHLVEDGGWSTEPAGVMDYAPFLESIHAGQRYRFRLRANTVRSTKDRETSGPATRGRVVNVGSRALQEDWLLTRVPALGFRIPADETDLTDDSGEIIGRKNLVLTERNTLQFARSTDGMRRNVTLATALFDGVLEVADPEALRRVLQHGVGRGKAYGCGLLTLAPVT